MKSLSVAAVVCTLCVCTPVSADQLNVIVEPYRTLINDTVPVNAGQYIHYQLQLTRGGALVVRFNVSGGVNNQANVWLLDSSNFQRFRADLQFNAFEGTYGAVQGIASYTFPVPKTDIYA